MEFQKDSVAFDNYNTIFNSTVRSTNRGFTTGMHKIVTS